MFLFAAADTLQGIAGTASAVTVTVSGVNVTVATGVEAFGLLYQGQLPNSAGVLFTVPAGHAYIIKTIIVTNATGSSVSGVQLFQGGSAAANSIIGPITLAAHYTLTGSENGWAVTDANGIFQTAGSGITTLTGDVTAGPGSGSVAATVVQVNGAVVPASQAYVGTNSSRQIVAATAPAIVNLSGVVTFTQTGGSGSVTGGAWVFATAGSAITISSIPSGYNVLKVYIQAASSTSGAQDDLDLQFNADTGTNYSRQYQVANVTSVSAGQQTATTSIHLSMAGATAPSGTSGTLEVTIPNYARTVFNKMMKMDGTYWVNTGATGIDNITVSGYWASTAAITSIKLFPDSGANFVAGSTFIIYGIL